MQLDTSSIFKIKKKDINKDVGTGFIVSTSGYFFTAKHNIELTLIDSYIGLYQGVEYKLQRIDKVNYSVDFVDIVLLRLVIRAQETKCFIPYNNEEKVALEKVENCVIYGYFNGDNEQKEIKKKIIKNENNIYLLEYESDIEIGLSGAPVFANNQLVGIISGFDKKNILVTDINLCKNLVEQTHKKYFRDLKKCKKISYFKQIPIFLRQNTFKFSKLLHQLEHIYIDSERVLEEEKLKENKLKEKIQKVKQEIYSIKKVLNTVENIIRQELDDEFTEYILNEKKQIEEKLIQNQTNLSELVSEEKENNKNELTSNEIRKILDKYKEIFNSIAKDVSLNLKILTSHNTLKTYKRTPSNYEIEKVRKGELPARSNDELFFLEYPIDVKEFKKKYTVHTDKVNSAYNEVLYTNEKIWLCNDLREAEDNELYYSTSKNANWYYNSLAVFALTSRDSEMKDRFGLLIIDSIHKDTFKYNYFREVGGYLTHKLHRFIKNNIDFDKCDF